MKWDYSIDSEVKWFDRSKSYELSGYRPIDEENGLDFDLTPFILDALNKERTGKYTEFKKGTKSYAEFWKERARRCREGYEVNGYRLTGDNYFFINFYRIFSAKTGYETFPTFTNVQYEWFHYVEIAEKLGLDCVALKARGVGWSEMAASMGVCPYIVRRLLTMFYTASKEDYLTNLLDKAWYLLDWLNRETDDGFKKLRQVKNSQFHKRASMLDREKNEFGTMTLIVGVTADVPNKVRGFRSHRLFFEEAGSNPVFLTSWVQGEALVTRGGRKMGTKFCWGTGGDSGAALAGLAAVFNNPQTFDCLPYVHNFTPSGDTVLTGFFIPAYRMHFDYLDDRGVTNTEKAKAYFLAQRDKKQVNPLAYLEYCSEYCFTPEDALIREGSNNFNLAALAELLSLLLIHKTVKIPVKGFLMGGNDIKGGTNPIVFKPDINGDTLILEEPIRDEDGNVMKNLYCAGIDSIDVGKNDSTGLPDVSDFCIVIKKRVHGLKEPLYVAMYKGRPNDVRQAYANAIRMMEWYNCRCVVETTRTNIITYAREKKKIHLFMTRPRATISNVKTNTTMIGAPATEGVIKHYLEKLEEFVNDYSHTICFEEMLLLFLRYDYDNKRKFDIIAACGMAELADEELFAAPIVSLELFKKTWRDIGYFRDIDGKMHYGAIPTKEELSTYHLR